MSNDHDTGNRLLSLIKALKSNQKQFAKAIGVSQSFVYQMIAGQKRISGKVIEGISNAYKGVNTNWLYTGDGEMFLSEKTHEVNEPAIGYKLAVDEVPGVIQTLQFKIEELERRLSDLEKKSTL